VFGCEKIIMAAAVKKKKGIPLDPISLDGTM
jgi:hypothetical protein